MTLSSTHIDKCIVSHPNVFVLVNKCSSQVNCEHSIHFSTMSVINVLHTHTHTHTHTHHIHLGIRSSVRHIISYGVSTLADVTLWQMMHKAKCFSRWFSVFF